MLFKSATLAGIREGRITLAFRRWPRARVKVGSRIRTSAGLVSIETIVRKLKELGLTESLEVGYRIDLARILFGEVIPLRREAR